MLTEVQIAWCNRTNVDRSLDVMGQRNRTKFNVDRSSDVMERCDLAKCRQILRCHGWVQFQEHLHVEQTEVGMLWIGETTNVISCCELLQTQICRYPRRDNNNSHADDIYITKLVLNSH